MRMKSASLLAGLLLALPLAAAAADETPAKNPDYAHALPDLRTARWLLTQQPGDPPVRTNEDQAIQDIDVAIRTITKGRFDDHKDINDHEQMEMAKDHTTRLHQALEMLHRAHAYISKEVADPMGVTVRNQALENIDRAGRAIGRALEVH
jgi:hypothetical protein